MEVVEVLREMPDVVHELGSTMGIFLRILLSRLAVFKGLSLLKFEIIEAGS